MTKGSPPTISPQLMLMPKAQTLILALAATLFVPVVAQWRPHFCGNVHQIELVTNIPPLLQGNEYVGPQVDASNHSCAICQGEMYTTLQVPIPPEVSIPAWAYVNLTAAGIFDPTLAQRLSTSNLTDSSSIPTPTAPSSSSPSLSSPSPSSPSSQAKQQKAHNGTVAIVGGIVGGVVVALCLLVAGVVCFKRRQQRRYTRPTDRMCIEDRDWDDADPNADPQKDQLLSEGEILMDITSTSHKPHDPYDPSTLPSEPAFPSYDLRNSSSRSLLIPPTAEYIHGETVPSWGLCKTRGPLSSSSSEVMML
ncbi:hypothetical protein BU17DRAFT_66368 [Hysterangium stoloniferum]|nr:hypothetical protein BU17DRAFT_66368 [Hysterangium stoloniferum]